MLNAVREIRLKRKLTQEALAKRVEISRTHLSEIENGNVVPSVLTAQRIARALKVKTESIFFDHNVV